MTEPKSQAPKKNKVFARPPSHWDQMTRAEKRAWAAEFLARIKAAAKLPPAD